MKESSMNSMLFFNDEKKPKKKKKKGVHILESKSLGTFLFDKRGSKNDDQNSYLSGEDGQMMAFSVEAITMGRYMRNLKFLLALLLSFL